eukprot:2989502-Prymnesium_polylepis.1
MAAVPEELAQATRRWQQWSDAAASKTQARREEDLHRCAPMRRGCRAVCLLAVLGGPCGVPAKRRRDHTQ